VEETGVEGLEDFVEIIVMAGGCGEAFAATGLADVLGLFGDGFGGDVAAVAVGVDTGDGFLVEFGEEDVSDGVMDGLGMSSAGMGARGRSSRYSCSKIVTREVGAGDFFARGFLGLGLDWGLDMGYCSMVAGNSWKRVGGGADCGEKSCRN
jgi:hypothetical protein